MGMDGAFRIGWGSPRVEHKSARIYSPRIRRCWSWLSSCHFLLKSAAEVIKCCIFTESKLKPMFERARLFVWNSSSGSDRHLHKKISPPGMSDTTILLIRSNIDNWVINTWTLSARRFGAPLSSMKSSIILENERSVDLSLTYRPTQWFSYGWPHTLRST